ncbi:MAG: DUF222 domain-containing protein [Frankiales bacterium]|nr:DUF222 domain-containing protein [Frankiales bacterium]
MRGRGVSVLEARFAVAGLAGPCARLRDVDVVRAPGTRPVRVGPAGRHGMAPRSPLPPRVAARAAARRMLSDALARPVSAATAAELVAVDPALLDEDGLLDRLRLADRVAAWAAAQAARALSDLADADTSTRAIPGSVTASSAWIVADPDRALALEVRLARSCSDSAARRDLDAARRLARELRSVRDAWECGAISSRHVAAFLDRTAGHDPATLDTALTHVLARVGRLGSHRVGAELTRVLTRLDPAGQAARIRRARRHDLGVWFRPLPDGLGQITAVHRIEDARAIIEALDTDADRFLAHRRGCPPCAAAVPDEIGPARAAAHLDRVLAADDISRPGAGADVDASDGPGAPARTGTADPEVSAGRRRRGGGRRSRRGELQVVVDLATLLGLAEEPGLLSGQPVPAEIARELATSCGSMRRVVTDPVDGHLLDYGTRTYLPDALRAFVAARDGTCRSPGCGQPAHRSQLDHVVPFPHGPSDTANTHALCARDHSLKTDGHLRYVEHGADGRAAWCTRLGQYGTTPARSYLPEPLDAPPGDVSGTGPDVPPF